MGEETESLSVNDGLFLLNAVRDVILSYVREKSWVEKPDSFPQSLTRAQGVFVSIVEKAAGETGEQEKYILSIGNPLPSVSLIDTAFSGATKTAIDLSCNPSANSVLLNSVLRIDLIGDLDLVEVANPMKYVELVTVGKDGLVVERGHCKGVLRPGVATAERWTVQDFLSQCCMRAGLMADAWLQNAARIYRFQTQVFEGKLEN